MLAMIMGKKIDKGNILSKNQVNILYAGHSGTIGPKLASRHIYPSQLCTFTVYSNENVRALREVLS